MIDFPHKATGLAPNISKLTLIILVSICCGAFSQHCYAQNNTIQKVNPQTKLSFNFQEISVKNILQLIAKSSNLNFIISDNVKGTISLNLANVTWQQALDLVVKTQGLATQRVGNVLYISTLEDITNTQAKEMRSQEMISSLAPLKSILLHLNYTNADDLAGLLKGNQSNLLTSRGQIAVDKRTNSLIIRDTQKNLDDILPEVKKLDVPAKQVLIEARIVNVDVTYEEQLGVRFGLSNTKHLSGSLAGANQINQGIAPNMVDYGQRLNFNVPGQSLTDGSVPGSIGLALAKVGNLLLDLELSALEGENKAKIISRPRIMASNQQKAVIQTGEEIPYQEASSSGATSVTFKKAVLSLEIIPQITPDNRINLRLKATQDTRGDNVAVGASNTTGTGSGGVVTIPAINTQEVESNILLKNNETIAIGGVFSTTKQNTYDRIPFFGELPIVGRLFSHTGVKNQKHELLVFITPKIVDINLPKKPTHQSKQVSLKSAKRKHLS